MNKPRAAMVDLDGCLVDVSSFHADLLKTAPTDHDAFNRKALDCPPYKHMAGFVRWLHRNGTKIVIATARNVRYKGQTEVWLAINDIPYDELLMRPSYDDREDVAVKQDMLETAEVGSGYDVVIAVDDRPDNLEMYRNECIPFVIDAVEANEVWDAGVAFHMQQEGKL